MNKLNVLFIASGRNIGLTFNLSRLAIALKEFGHEIIVVSEPKEEKTGLVEELKQRGIQHYALSGIDAFSVKKTLNAARAMGKIVDYYNVNVVHAQGIRQLVAAFLACKVFAHRKKVGIVASIHTTLHGGPHENVALLIESFFLNICADLAMPVAKSVAEDLVNFGAIRNKVVTIYNGIDLNLLDKVMCNDEYSSVLLDEINDSSVIVVGYFARLDRVKGHRYLIKAISEVSKTFPNIKLILTGEGPLRDELVNLSRALNLEEKVLFTGKISHESLYKLLKRVDIYAFPSLAELFPYAILEAMAGGKPIVATNVGGVVEVIKNEETGLLVPPGDSTELAKGIKSLINNPIEAKEMGIRCRKLIEGKFTLHKIAHDLTRCYELSTRRKVA